MTKAELYGAIDRAFEELVHNPSLTPERTTELHRELEKLQEEVRRVES